MEHNHIHNHDNTEIKPPKTPFKDFIPLIIIFAAIIFFTVIRVVTTADTDLMFVMRNFMGGFFIIFGGFKVLNWKGFVEAYGIYDIIAKRSKIYGYLYPLIELGLGVAYLTAFNLIWINWVTLIIMLIGAIGVAQKIAEHEVIPCACLGVVFKIPMTKVTLIEDLLMAGMAIWMIALL